MDKKLQEYLDSLVSGILTSPNFTNLSDEQREAFVVKINDHFQNIIFDTLVNNLNTEQLTILKNIGLSSPAARVKIEEFASEIPNFAGKIEQALMMEVEKIKLNPQVLV